MEKLKDLRKKYNFTQEEVAKALDITQQAYAVMESSNRKLNMNQALKLSKLFNCSINSILSIYSSYENMVDDSIEEFLDKSKTSYHAVKNASKILEDNGFRRLYENEKWVLKENDKCYLTKNDSAIFAFTVGNLENYSFKICGCHTDSPSLRIKGKELIDSCEGKRINVEDYGGLIKYSFMDIPLKVAGRILKKKDEKIVPEVVTSEFNVNIPSICIHHNPSVNSGYEFNTQNDMLPLIKGGNNIYECLTKDEVIDADLFCVPSVKPYYSGLDSELLVSPRIDNLTSVYSIIKSITSVDGDGINIAMCFDNEEIGSFTKQGAKSIIVEQLLKKINESLGMNNDDYLKACMNGFIISIDNGHAAHPAKENLYDPKYKCLLNNGVVLKHHTNYSTDGLSSSIFKMICEKNNVKYQEYYNRSDIRCGSTIGNINSCELEMNTCDIGLAQLSMHSAIETVGRFDIIEMIKLIKSFYKTNIVYKDNEYIIN